MYVQVAGHWAAYPYDGEGISRSMSDDELGACGHACSRDGAEAAEATPTATLETRRTRAVAGDS